MKGNNLESRLRNSICAITAAISLIALVASVGLLVVGEIRRPQWNVSSPVIVLLLSTSCLRLAYLAYNRHSARFLLPVWAFTAGIAAPFIPATIREFFLSCPPPAIRCQMIGAAPWPVLTACVLGLLVVAYMVWREANTQTETTAESSFIPKPLKFFCTALALSASAILILIHYDLAAQEIKNAVEDAIATERARAAGRIIIRDIVDGPSEALTVFIGMATTLITSGVSLKGSISWLAFIWPFVLGLVLFPIVGAFDSLGSFGWDYRDFVEKYAWFALSAICCAGLLTAWRTGSDFAKPQA